MDDTSIKFTDQEALDFHSRGKPGKLEVTPTKPMATQRDLSLAYSPGVAVPVRAIADNPDLAYDYTSKGNMVAVISNGTAILGLGDLGALAAKPVMEGKSVLFKRFADIDSIDIEVDTKDPDEFINCVKYLGPAFGGINLEDIAAPESFLIEQRLKELMDIPVFHDDQHGTAIISAAGLLNALDITGKSIREVKIAIAGAGSAALAVASLIKAMGAAHDNVLVCGRKGVIYKGRDEPIDQWRSAHAVDTDKRTLADAMNGADVCIGLSVAGAVSKDMVKSMAKNPVIFAMANPTPEITPEEIRDVRKDAIIATGRSDYPNQVNNVLGFPYIFRGALDARARTINEEMKIACAQALAKLAREDVPDEVAAAYGKRLKYGPGYIIPTPFDPRLISTIPPAVAKAAAETGVARKPIEDIAAYAASLAARTDPSASFLQTIYSSLRSGGQKRIVFAEGEEESVVRAAHVFQQEGLGRAVLIGREEQVKKALAEAGLPTDCGFEIHNARLSSHNPTYTDYLYRRLQRKGYLHRDAQRLVNVDRNVFGACMLAHGHADGMVTGVTRHYDVALENVKLALDPRPGERLVGVSIILARGRTLFVADTNISELPTPEDLAEIAVQVAHAARHLGAPPKVAFVSYSNFGNPDTEHSRRVSGAVRLLDKRADVDFEYEGEMTPRMALNERYRTAAYPFSRLKGEANVLITPGVHSAAISSKLLGEVGGATVLGPVLIGLEKPVQITQIGARVPDIVTLAAVAAYEIDKEHRVWAGKAS
jgi:malate dehydrogenase (oxaloacetate-decarboxylating)(NADP+)